MGFLNDAKKAGMLEKVRKDFKGWLLGDADEGIVDEILKAADTEGVRASSTLQLIGNYQRDRKVKPGMYGILVKHNKAIEKALAGGKVVDLDSKRKATPKAAPSKKATAPKPRASSKPKAAPKKKPASKPKAAPKKKVAPKRAPSRKPAAKKAPAKRAVPKPAPKRTTTTKPRTAGKKKSSGLPIHRVASSFPRMAAEDFDNLKADIAKNGQVEPIVLVGRQIIDGVHRYRACQDLEIVPITEQYSGATTLDALTAYAVSRNLARRHLTSGQKAALAAELLPEFEAAAKERQRKRRHKKDEAVDESETGKATEHVAKITGTNPRYVAFYKRLTVEAPDLAEQVKAGEITLAAAISELDRKKAEKAQGRRISKRQTTGTYGVIVVHVPGRSYRELLESEAIEVVGNDCVMFLWCKPTNIGEAVEALSILGFSHKTTYTWVKESPDRAGTYLKDQTEHCLIGIKGKPKYMLKGQTTILLEYTDPEQGDKPEEFYELVTALTSARKRLLIDCSVKHPGYDILKTE